MAALALNGIGGGFAIPAVTADGDELRADRARRHRVGVAERRPPGRRRARRRGARRHRDRRRPRRGGRDARRRDARRARPGHGERALVHAAPARAVAAARPCSPGTGAERAAVSPAVRRAPAGSRSASTCRSFHAVTTTPGRRVEAKRRVERRGALLDRPRPPRTPCRRGCARAALRPGVPVPGSVPATPVRQATASSELGPASRSARIESTAGSETVTPGPEPRSARAPRSAR